jgi:hypothetical protein
VQTCVDAGVWEGVWLSVLSHVGEGLHVMSEVSTVFSEALALTQGTSKGIWVTKSILCWGIGSRGGCLLSKSKALG